MKAKLKAMFARRNRLHKKLAELNEQIRLARNVMYDSGKCDHDAIVEKSWEWDSGHGVQRMLKKHECVWCSATNHWPNCSKLWSRMQ